ncbi:sensor histidine kinase [Sphingomonas quercus]|uniref:histidine kinase n=1 Tax=Sphingomonas quercus TaxID=2842451 RepID=A0ABS6BI68_9SPHN|nr:sensor histidine kinase [Sphingomonas quercus]MBU3077136.1 sensor histidine kinase [Sphingomonas quercus]
MTSPRDQPAIAPSGVATPGDHGGESAMARPFTGLPTNAKLILLMLLALTPLMIIAVLASAETARINRAARESASLAIATDSARAIDVLVARTALTLRASGTALSTSGEATCQRTLSSLAAEHRVAVDFALRDIEGRLICSTSGYQPIDRPVVTRANATIHIGADGETLIVTTFAGNDRLVGEARFARATIAETARPRLAEGPYRLVLREGDRSMALGGTPEISMDGTTNAVPVVDGQGRLELSLPTRRATASEMLSIALPVVMLLAAGLVAFIVTDRLMLRPLRQLQAAVLAYRAGDKSLVIPRITTPAHEIRRLASAFRSVTNTIGRHEADLEEGLARQTRLTREVHHRVKNNLQVVASLLSLHARGAQSREVADAYASIQRRVDALAVVHRNHYAELEENRGVALRPLISELAANLRATAPANAVSMPILLELESLHATQDVAVPVAFLITEMVEASMLRAPKGTVAIGLTQVSPTRAALSVASPALTAAATEADGKHGERFDRVLTGLARQLRATLERDEAAGRLSIEIGIV